LIALAEAVRTGDALAAARELLPAWVVWGRTIFPPLLVFLAQFCVGGWTVALLERKAGPASGLHWTERARLVTDTKTVLQILAMCVIAPALAIPTFLSSPFDLLPQGATALLTVLVALFAGRLGDLWVRRALAGQRVSWREWCGETFAYYLVFHPAGLIAIVCLAFCGREPGPVAIALLLVGTLCMLGPGLLLSFRLLSALGLVRPFEPRAYIAEPPPGVRLFEIDLGMANAVAVPHARSVFVTRRARELLAPAELAALLQHEFGHLAEPGRVLALRAAGLLPYIALAWLRPLMGWLGTAGGLLPFYACWIIAYFVGRRSSSWEQRADVHAHEHVEDKRVYARALERMHEHGLIPAVTSAARTHPHLYDRIVSAGVEPGYARPVATRSRLGWGLVVGIVLGFWLGGVDHWTRPDGVPPEEHAVLRALAFGGYTDVHLDTLADIRKKRGDIVSAARFRAAAEELRGREAQAGTGSQR
jgi:Zn-dependent protease with chaperone function